MRAVVVDEVGESARPRLADVARVDPGADEVLVRMRCASVNPADWKCQQGWMTRYPQFRPSFPFVLGFDGVGVVAAVGAGVTDVAPGERVCVRANQMIGQHGTFAEYVCVARSDTAPVPDAVSDEHAATIPVAGVTAYQAVVKYAKVRPGQRVLVNGASGGVGSYAVQLAVHAGARAAGTSGPGNLDYLRALGCEHVIDYRSEQIAESTRHWASDGVETLLDTVHVDGVPDAAALLAPGGVVVGIVTLGAQRPYDDAELRRSGHGFVEATVRREEARADMIALGRLLADGAIGPPDLEVITFERAPEALERIAAGHVRGKIVLSMGA